MRSHQIEISFLTEPRKNSIKFCSLRRMYIHESLQYEMRWMYWIKVYLNRIYLFNVWTNQFHFKINWLATNHEARCVILIVSIIICKWILDSFACCIYLLWACNTKLNWLYLLFFTRRILFPGNLKQCGVAEITLITFGRSESFLFDFLSFIDQ